MANGSTPSSPASIVAARVDAFTRTTETWDLSQAEAARLFGVSRQAVGKWRRHGVPRERAGAVADLAAATDLLVRHLKRDRIPAVVRRPIPALDGVSLVELLGARRYARRAGRLP